MSELLYGILLFIGYLFVGGIVLYLEKAVEVIIYKDSSYWKDDEDDIMRVLFWPLIVFAGIAYLTIYLTRFICKNIIGKFIITVTEVGIALFNLNKKNKNENNI